MAIDVRGRGVDVLICDAIGRRRLLSFDYDGGLRLVQPAVLGLHRTTDRLSLRAFQVGGLSRSGAPAGWRLYTVRKLRQPLVHEEGFGAPPSGYQPDDDELWPILCQLGTD